MRYFVSFCTLFLSVISSDLYAQFTTRKCATDERMEMVFQKDPAARTRYKLYQQEIDKKIDRLQSLTDAEKQLRTTAIVNVPVVVHILTSNPNLVTASVVQRQIDTLNWYYGAQAAGDSLRVYEPFRPLYGRSQIRFCLAQRDPNNQPTTGITQKTTNTKFTDNTADGIQRSAEGGVDAWDTRRYLNMWVVEFSNQTLGYSYLPGTFPPGDGRMGFVADYRAFGSGASYLYPNYNGGKTAVHEIGHYFNLLHPWGPGADNPDCNQSDLIGDTPPTAGPTFGCPASPVLDACSPNPPGKMAQNHMDYADDRCLVLFTKEQVTRMEATLNTSPDRITLISSNGCVPPGFNRDIRPTQFLEPFPTICEATTLRPIIEVYNAGLDTIKSFTVNYSLNGAAIATSFFTGSLPFNSTATVTLQSLALIPGTNIIQLYTSLPNGLADQAPTNDTIVYIIKVLTPLANGFREGFEGTFPPTDWEVVQNPVDNITWQKTIAAGKNSASSVFINNYNYATVGRIDDLLTPPVKYNNVDSVYMKFDVAAASYSFAGSSLLPTDTLEVLASTNCGITFTSVYKKWGEQLQTVGTINTSGEFFPGSNAQWRTDSINVTPVVGTTNTVRFAFRNKNNRGNNIFIDNVHVYTRTLPVRLKNTGVLISPNPFRDKFLVQLYQPLTDLKGYAIYNSFGQMVQNHSFSPGTSQSYFEISLSNVAAGVYFVRFIFSNGNVTQKIIKTN